ncbi:MAG: hypothetical protein SVR94_15590 [Pseudomonadota bacterium]|nr:hypothetical protein [Pseudomonadota bacterium]
MAKIQITAEQFWDYYFRDDFINLKRDNNGYMGEIYENTSQSHTPLSLVKEFSKKNIEISKTILKKYDYSNDKRFFLISTPTDHLSKAFTAVLEKTYDYRQPAPFGKQRMSELFVLLRHHYQLNPNNHLTISLLEKTLKQMIESYSKEMIQPIAALVWFLGECRQISSADVLILTVENSKYIHNSVPSIHFTAVNTAFNALWKINPKLKLPNLIKLMKQANESGKRKFAPLFTRLLSTNEMLSLDLLGNDYLNPDYWAGIIKRYNHNTQLDWDQFDTNALFWEIRYLAALRLPSTDANLIKLANDEVSIIAKTVQQQRS